ncbi:type 1 fimbrial protein [Pseudomonas sp. ANT_J12]|jgi:major type 1 subunit fimbrin (pilin)|uniref:fimbrial protein n=1 Tax=Pseudomonas TaxID=286 RepID=UPI0011F21062|nr:type 1 fimbrial protein [Pseudomonas sp. ANT_J12]KAA0983001.1 type 1 fimbrial protein [Pseudomonas sp. ANT_J12]
MKKLSFIALAIAAAAAMSSTANAASGTLQFTGNLTAASCTVTPGGDASAGAGSNIVVDMGSVSFSDLETAAPGKGSVGVAVTDLSFDIGCTGVGAYDTVVLNFDPQAGSGRDTADARLLALAPGGAAGAAIAVVDGNRNIIDMSKDPEVRAALTVDAGTGAGTAQINLAAAYLRTTGAQTPGAANGSLPFVLTYE